MKYYKNNIKISILNQTKLQYIKHWLQNKYYIHAEIII